MTVTVKDLIDYLQELPLDMPVVQEHRDSIAGRYSDLWFERRRLRKAPGGWAEFKAPSLVSRNDTDVLVIR